MNVRGEYLKLIAKGLPLAYKDVQWDESPIMSFAKFQRFISGLASGTVHFVYNDRGQIINRIILDELFEARDIKIIDFGEYYSQSFDSGNFTPTSKFLYLYNIGTEQVNNYTIPDKKLASIIHKNKLQNNVTVLVSNIFNVTTFKRNYPISAELLDTNQQILKTI